MASVEATTGRKQLSFGTMAGQQDPQKCSQPRWRKRARTLKPSSPAFPADAPPSNAPINITFRFYRPDFAPGSTPKCKCGVPYILRPDMKNRSVLDAGGGGDKYWWTCYAGAQNDGKGCNMWMVMDMDKECRGPTVGSMKSVYGDTEEPRNE